MEYRRNVVGTVVYALLAAMPLFALCSMFGVFSACPTDCSMMMAMVKKTVGNMDMMAWCSVAAHLLTMAAFVVATIIPADSMVCNCAMAVVVAASCVFDLIGDIYKTDMMSLIHLTVYYVNLVVSACAVAARFTPGSVGDVILPFNSASKSDMH